MDETSTQAEYVTTRTGWRYHRPDCPQVRGKKVRPAPPTREVEREVRGEVGTYVLEPCGYCLPTDEERARRTTGYAEPRPGSAKAERARKAGQTSTREFVAMMRRMWRAPSAEESA